MTNVITENDDGTTTIKVSFADEGIALEGETTVKGNTATAQSYLPVYEADLRANFAYMFPIIQPDPMPMGGTM